MKCGITPISEQYMKIILPHALKNKQLCFPNFHFLLFQNRIKPIFNRSSDFKLNIGTLTLCPLYSSDGVV